MERPLDRVDKALHALDLTRRGLEIGPSYNPLVTKADGYQVETLDHATREELVEKYRGYGLDEERIGRIEEVDHLWHGGSLLDVVTDRGAYGYVIASHFIEHTVDFVGFLQECSALLADDGLLSLVIPDKRFCFDRFHPLTTLGDVVDGHHRAEAGALYHPAGAIVDHLSYACTNEGSLVWTPQSPSQLAIQFGDLAAAATGLEDAVAQKEYVDTHRWKFTPASFDLLLADLAELGLHDLEVVERHDTSDYEFFVTLRKGAAARGPRDRLAALLAIEAELGAASGSVLAAVATRRVDALQSQREAGHDAALRGLGEQADSLRTWNLHLQREVEELRRSTSWRVTKPLRLGADTARSVRRRGVGATARAAAKRVAARLR